LFGHQRGAFTGAHQARAGLIEAADGGTLFLDEVGELSADAQTKLLRVLEAREVLRVGAASPRPVDVRFIAATNVDLDAATVSGRFREDLLYRLDGIRLCVPPLRARPHEVVPAAVEFLEAVSGRDRQAVPVLTPAAESALRRHPWPGNFRELRNVMERAAVICSNGRIEPADLMLPESPRTATVPVASLAVVGRGPAAGHTVDAPAWAATVTASRRPGGPSVERERIVLALNECAGNQTRAARLLGMSRGTLITRMQAFGLARPQARQLRNLPTAHSANAHS
jgi:two-component system response regulator AtoC